MEGEQPFASRLAAAVERRRTTIETDDLPKLKELFRVFHASFQGLHQLLIRKGLIQQDPYKGEQKISDIEPPDDEQYLDSERHVAIGIRMDAYDNTLEFLNNYFEFRTDALGFKELKQLSDLTRYIAWDQFTSHSPKPTTRGLSDLVARARGGQDGFANSIIADALDQLSRSSKSIIDQIKSVATFKREEYKLTLREQLMTSVENPERYAPDDAASLDELRRLHRSLGLPGPFVPELMGELLAEDYGPQGEQKQNEALERLAAGGPSPKKSRPKESLREVLIGTIRGIAAASRSLETIVEHLKANIEITKNQTQSFGQRLRAWIDKLTNRQPEKVSYQVEYTDEMTGARHTETVVADDFLALVTRKARLYVSFLGRTGTPWLKLQKASDEQLYQFINKELGECHLIHRRAGALDDAIKAKVSATDRKRMKGVKIELTAVRNAIVKANQLKHEYVAKKEEQDQLRKLGMER